MINSFDGEYEFLSNFFPSPIVMHGLTYPTVEHYYQAMKAISDEDREKIRNAETPRKAKNLGKKVELDEGWEYTKCIVMYNALKEKFKDPILREQLIQTGTQELIEGNNWGDKFWGVCNGEGKNTLGKYLMEIRSNLSNIKQIAMGCKPDPFNFKIKHIEHLNGCTIVVANYGGLTFGGDKLMVIRGIYDKFESLDPHFLNEDYPVFARFQPTENGMKLAKLVCQNWNTK